MFGAVVLGILASTRAPAKANQFGRDFAGGSSYIASQDSGSPYTIGWSFTTSETLSVSGLGFWDDDDHTLGFSHDVGLWDSSQNLLASTAITSTSTPVASTGPGQWLFNAIGKVTLVPGTCFIGAAYVKADDVDAYRYYVSNIATVDGLTFDSAQYVLWFRPRFSGPGSRRQPQLLRTESGVRLSCPGADLASHGNSRLGGAEQCTTAEAAHSRKNQS
jgi:Domain of unknown function (DUF4082)